MRFSVFYDYSKTHRGNEVPYAEKKANNMTTIRFAYYLNSECHKESLKKDKDEWSVFVYSYKIKQKENLIVGE